MLVELCCVLVVLPTLWGYQCQSPDGYVDWWAVLRIPRTQELIYVDSHSDDIQEIEHLWEDESPLRLTMTEVSLDSSNTDYMTYATDWANVVVNRVSSEHVTKGMFVYEVGLLRSGGFWIIHSSPLFPPDMNGKIITNTSDPIWESVLQHSPNDRNDLYFVCVSIDGDQHLSQLVDHWLLSNPSVFKESLRKEFWNSKLTTSSFPRSTLLYKAAGKAFDECFYSTHHELQENCFHEYVDPDVGLYLVTKIRGMEKHAAQMCINFIAGPGEDDFVQWDIQFSPPGTNTPALSRGIRAISLSFICFGSDVTQTGDLALGMACINHPRLGQWLVSLKINEDWSCKSALLARFKNGEGWNAYIGKKKDLVSKPTVQRKTPKERQKVQNIEKRGDLEKVLYDNPHAILAIFYRKGCRYCDTADKTITSLAESLWEYYDIDIVKIDIMVLGLPARLYPNWVPTIKYRKPIRILNTTRNSNGDWVTQRKLSFEVKDVSTFINMHQRTEHKEIKKTNNMSEMTEPKQDEVKEGKTRPKRSIDSDDSDPEKKKRKIPANKEWQPKRKKQKKSPKPRSEQSVQPDNQCQTDKKETDKCSELLQEYHQDEAKELLRCVGIGINDLDNRNNLFGLDALNECEPKKKDRCPRDDEGKRRLFLGLEEGCTLLKASLVKICGNKLTELHKIMCINGNPYKLSDKKYKIPKRTSYHAEGHLMLYLKQEVDLKSFRLKGNEEDNCNIEMWLVLNYNPCYSVCSGANNQGQRNIPKLKELLETELGKTKLRIAFARFYEEGDEKINGSLHYLSEMNNTSVHLCHYPQEWWNEYGQELSPEARKTVQGKWHESFNSTSRRMNEWGIQITKKPSCIYPTKGEHEDFIQRDWPEL